MDFETIQNIMEDASIFVNSPCPLEQEGVEADIWNCPCVDYVQKGDSMKYISQFLDLVEEEMVTIDRESQSNLQAINNGQSQQVVEIKKDQLLRKEKKIKRTENSPFHNYQKHLNNALKKLIIVPEFSDNDETYKKVAQEIWAQYISLDIKTKRILHYIFNERNEHVINEAELRTYRLLDLYQLHGPEVFNRAKIYLSKLAIDQIDEQNIDGYLKTRKLKKLGGLKEYILQFRQELSNGYLKRRLNPENLLH